MTSNISYTFSLCCSHISSVSWVSGLVYVCTVLSPSSFASIYIHSHISVRAASYWGAASCIITYPLHEISVALMPKVDIKE